MKKGIFNKKTITTWKAVRPWLTFIVLLLVLRYTGILAGISIFASQQLMNVGLMQAEPITPSKKEVLDYNFTIRDLNGNKIAFTSFKGKVIFINLWATWCGPCRAEMPSIQKLYDTVDKEKIAFVMLSLDDATLPKKVKKYVESNQYTFPVYITSELPSLLNVQTIPTTFVVDKDGTVVHQKAGMSDYSSEKFKKFLEELTQ